MVVSSVKILGAIKELLLCLKHRRRCELAILKMDEVRAPHHRCAESLELLIIKSVAMSHAVHVSLCPHGAAFSGKKRQEFLWVLLEMLPILSQNRIVCFLPFGIDARTTAFPLLLGDH